jgi:hypothetical protein
MEYFDTFAAVLLQMTASCNAAMSFQLVQGQPKV